MSYTVGQPVHLRKYGGKFYPGTVTKVGRSTVTVAFRTKAGDAKVFTVPGYAVEHDLRPACEMHPYEAYCLCCEPGKRILATVPANWVQS